MKSYFGIENYDARWGNVAVSPIEMPLVYLRQQPKSLVFRIKQVKGYIEVEREDGEKLLLEPQDWWAGDWPVYMKILNFLLNKTIEKSKMLLSAGGEFTRRERIKEINDELDIIRGVAPTPPGYKIAPQKIKELMAELAQIVKEENA